MAESTHSYFDWQLSTLLLAYDAVDPLPRRDIPRLTERQHAVERELHALAIATLPKNYLDNPEADFPPEIVILLTRATLRRAAQITGLLPKQPSV